MSFAVSSAVGPAPAPDLRRWLARARGRHHGRGWGDVLGDLYLLFWIFGVYGAVLVNALRDSVGLGDGPVGDVEAARYWLGLSLACGVAGLAWTVLRAVGPLAVGAAEQAWCLATPVDRARWLTPRFFGAAGGMAAVGCGLTLALAWVVTGDALAWAALAGAALGSTGFALAVLAQGAGPRARWPRLVGPGLLAGAAAGAAGIVVTHRLGASLPGPLADPLRVAALATAPLALATLVGADRTLPRLSRSVLARGSAVVGAMTTAAVALDPSILARVSAVRRWRHVGRVDSRPFRPWFGGAGGALLAADFRRLRRRPGTVPLLLALALAQVALAVAFPALGAPGRLVAGYAVGLHLSGGLATVAASPGLRRALGQAEWTVRGVHLVIPALGIGAWWWLTELAGGGPVGAAGYALLPLVVAATYRGATRPPMRYDGVVVETPFGSLPVDQLRQLVRGPDVLGGALVAQFLLGS